MRRCFYYPDGLDRISKLKPGCLWNNAVHETETDVVTERRYTLMSGLFNNRTHLLAGYSIQPYIVG